MLYLDIYLFVVILFFKQNNINNEIALKYVILFNSSFKKKVFFKYEHIKKLSFNDVENE